MMSHGSPYSGRASGQLVAIVTPLHGSEFACPEPEVVADLVSDDAERVVLVAPRLGPGTSPSPAQPQAGTLANR